ncbi:hypothetical protein [Cryobacterium sp. TMT1-66-1]|nr:hypothetical protein [Cryobacterium sp. TMT1-66-1]
MISLLPAGILDGIFSGTALILILTAYFGTQKISDAVAEAPTRVEQHQ